jgi:hypothetical protein
MVLDFLWALAIIVISSIPLYLAVKLMGGRGGIIRVIIVNVLVGLLVSWLGSTINIFVAAATFILMLFIYKVMFKLSWLKAFFAWILQFIIIIVIIVLLAFFGILSSII